MKHCTQPLKQECTRRPQILSVYELLFILRLNKILLCLTVIYYQMLIVLCCLAELFVFFAKKNLVRQEYRIKSVEDLSKVLI